ncbi:MAG: hypothetical protein N3F09_00845 [Bacteroidia bacterium]|nr:hypothetical protein [Bacteroidia bacterium]
MMRGIYTLGVGMYVLAITMASFFHAKARLWVKGRKKIFNRLNEKLASARKPVVWVHCASYGEFEQGRPLIERIFDSGEYFVLVTFFSPSGKEAFSNFPKAHHVDYLPPDFPISVRKFLNITQPRMAIFIRYEFWLNYLHELRKRQIPHYLVSAVFKPHHPFFRWYGGIFRKSLFGFKEIFVQDNASLGLLENIGIRNALVLGDSRIDRVLHIKNNPQPIENLKFWKKESKPVVCFGSIWPEDLQWILKWWGYWKKKYPNIKGILVPHEVDADNINRMLEKIKEASFKVSFWDCEPDNADFLMVNRMGLLSRLYAYADLAYVGGSMGAGVHNILEPAVYEIPVLLCGTQFSNFIEVEELAALNCLWIVKPDEDASGIIGKALHGSDKTAKTLKNYFKEKAGAADRMFQKIFNKPFFGV